MSRNRGDYGQSEAHASEQGQTERGQAPGQQGTESGGGEVSSQGVIVGGDAGGETGGDAGATTQGVIGGDAGGETTAPTEGSK